MDGDGMFEYIGGGQLRSLPKAADESYGYCERGSFCGVTGLYGS